MSWRRARRAKLLAARLALDPVRHEQASRVIEAQLAAHFLPFPARSVGLYWPCRREFDPLPFAARLIAGGVDTSLPVVVTKSGPLVFRVWQPGAAMVAGEYGIPVPAQGGTVLPEALLVPLLGFDGGGYRLGYGGGYYDRTIVAFPVRPLTIGIGFALGRLESIHPQPHDRPMDYVVTEEGVFRREEDGLRAL